MDMSSEQKQTPKLYCMITLMFPIENDKQAFDVKSAIDAALLPIPEKRFTFQIVDNR